MSLPFYDEATIRAALPFDRAIDAIEQALLADIDPEDDAPRLFSPAPGGEYLIMPSQGARYSGVKTLTIAPANPARGLEKIQGVFTLFSSDTLAPVALMEGATLTAIRTPATALCAVRALVRLAPERTPAAPRILVFGAGTQAHGLFKAAATVFPDATFDVIGRTPDRIAALRTSLAQQGLDVTDRTADTPDAVSTADIILCATTASTPLFDGNLVKEDAIIAAIGTHGLNLRELDDTLITRADLIVEGRTSARTENGNLATALTPENWRDNPPANLRDLISGNATRTPGRPAVFTGVGMSWEDLVCATVVHERLKG